MATLYGEKGVMKDYKKEIDAIIKELTLEEKVTMIHGAGFFRSGGVERLGIPSFYYSDGPMGVRADFQNDSWLFSGRDDDFATYFPSNSALASTWNPELAYETGKALGEETRGRGKDMILAPGINIKRDPKCGRNFEYMSEDPKLIERMCVPIIKGIQENDVSACVKHFALNNQESGRLKVDTKVDERTLYEIYLPGFKAAVENGKSYAIMGAYNKYDGVQCCENKRLLNEILRKEWGYDGVIVSDWGGVHSTVGTAESALDVEMDVTPNFDEYFLANPLIKAVKKGKVKEELIDEKVRNILRLMFRLKMIGPDSEDRLMGVYNSRAHQEAAYKAATESVILLKNDENVLPLNRKKLKNVVVIGANAITRHSNGGGSAEIKALYEIAPLMGLEMRLGGNVKVTYKEGYHIPTKAMNTTESWQAESTNEDAVPQYANVPKVNDDEFKEINKKLCEEAVEAARNADAVIFVGGLNHNYDIEGKDRDDIRLPYNQDELIDRLLDARPDTIVTFVAGSPVEMPWLGKASTVVWTYYAGMETGLALADIILGDVNPSGKLAESFPRRYEDTVTSKNGQFGDPDKVVYEEGVFYGYRYYEKNNIRTMFPFGHGLSYTEFEYSNFSILSENDGTEFEVIFNIKNTGKRAGKEIVQVYAGEQNPTVPRPVKELKGFAKVSLEPGESKRVVISLSKSDFAFYDESKKTFVTNKGKYNVYVGASSRDIKFEDVIQIR